MPARFGKFISVSERVRSAYEGMLALIRLTSSFPYQKDVIEIILKDRIVTHLRDSRLPKLLIVGCQCFSFRKNPLKPMVIFRPLF